MVHVWVMLSAQMWYFVSLLTYVGLNVFAGHDCMPLSCHIIFYFLTDSCTAFAVNKHLY